MPDPRFPGGVYYSDYWADWYTVLDVDYDGTRVREIVQAWSNGRVTRHCTPFGKRDRILVDTRPIALQETAELLSEPSVAMPKPPRKSARRLAASILLDAGIDRDEVQELLGD